LEPIDKCRGEGRALDHIVSHLREYGLSCGKVRIAHCQNETAAVQLQERIRREIPQADIAIASCRGLCSYYAEKGGLLVGFEKQ
jgi:fatty acid-binding protein DegV